MKKLLLLVLVILFAAAALGNLRSLRNLGNLSQEPGPKARRPILRVALVADSHDENDLLGKALAQAGGKGINFVIGLGDYTNLGTVEELSAAKREFDKSKLPYFLTAGDRDGWESRQFADGRDNFGEVFGPSSHQLARNDVQFVILDNSDIYRGIAPEDWESVNQWISEPVSQESDTPNHRLTDSPRLTFVFAHKTPFHPQSKHIMGEDSVTVVQQARELLNLLEAKRIDGFFAGDLHFFAKYNSPFGSVKITTIGAVASERNFQGPRFGILTVWDDYSWEVEDVEIRMDANENTPNESE